MKKSIGSVAMLSLLSVACHKMNFTPAGGDLYKASEGVPVVDARPIDLGLRKTGVCSNQESISSCLKCEPPLVTPPPPRLATKAEKLAKIMAASCPIPNKSYPNGYVSPTPEQVKSRLYACTEELYPETVMGMHQAATIGSLLDDNNPAMRNLLFSGLWYQPPYSDDYELYFGLTGAEAAYTFCMGQPLNPGPLVTTEYSKAVYGDYDGWLRSPAAQARWNAAQLQRKQLQSCLNKPASAPVAVVPPPVPGVVCDYKSYEGTFNADALSEISSDLQQGYKIAMETDLTCSLISVMPSASAYRGKVKIAAYRCQ